MSKKVLIIESSPRKKGNSVVLAEKAGEVLRESGVSVETAWLNGLKIGPCLHCNGCLRKKVFCVQQDDMQELYEKMIAADGLIFASPIYYFNINAQMKTVIDRWFGINQLKSDFLKDKPVGVVLTFEDKDVFVSGASNAIRMLEDIFKWVKTGPVQFVYGSVKDVGDAEKDAPLMEKAAQMGKKLAEML